uniref:Uncharacterized protein n=1 Tax=Gouania willdenowi TaxID=441366 RepID=A0A8C5EXW2_GOUWI
FRMHFFYTLAANHTSFFHWWFMFMRGEKGAQLLASAGSETHQVRCVAGGRCLASNSHMKRMGTFLDPGL